MNYHLNRHGRNEGIFPLEELRQKRAVGELNGTELIWCEGMPQWQTLDSILHPAPPPILPPSPRKSNRTLIIALLATAGGVFLLGSILMAGVAYFVAHRAKPEWQTDYRSEPLEVSTGIEASTKPVAPALTKTAADISEKCRAFRIRQYLEGYKLRGERNPECDKLAVGYLSNWIECNYGGTVDTNLPSLSDLGKQLANDPNCTDPVVLTVSGITSPNLFEAIHRLERATKGFENSKHLGYPKFYATVVLAEKIVQTRRYPVSNLDEKALQYFKDALSDGSIRPEDQDDIADSLLMGWARGLFDRHAGEIHSLVKTQGKDFEWLALVIDGEWEINAAWKARGNGYANTVSETGWKGFHDHLAKAREDLTRAWQLKPEYPLAPCLMMTVSLGDSDIEQMRLWFDRTVAAQIDYPKAWQEMRWGLRPRWFGDLDSMLAFGVTAIKTRRFDTDVPRQFVDSVTDMEQELGIAQGEHIYGREDIWPHFQEMYEGYIAEPSQTEYTRDGWRSAYAVIAYLAGKYDMARTQLQKMDWKPHEQNLNGYGRDLTLLACEVAARTGSQSKKIEAAENLRQRRDPAGALNIYEQLAADKTTDALTRTFVQERLVALNMEKSLRSGQWVRFMPADTNFTGWHVGLGKCKLLPDGQLEVEADEYGHLLYSRTPIGTEFEVRGQFEIVSSTSKAFQAGLVMGVPQFENHNWYGFRIKRNIEEGDVASFSQQWTTHQITSSLANLNSRTNSFDFRFHQGRISATLNGVPVFENVHPPQNSNVSTNEFLVGFGGFNSANSSVIRYRNVELRWLVE